uniref:Uncharacterized protein n=1 Tax=Panagrolaimus superbus TaxID=310955 RepID=A0A914YGP2_9BILA
MGGRLSDMESIKAKKTVSKAVSKEGKSKKNIKKAILKDDSSVKNYEIVKPKKRVRKPKEDIFDKSTETNGKKNKKDNPDESKTSGKKSKEEIPAKLKKSGKKSAAENQDKKRPLPKEDFEKPRKTVIKDIKDKTVKSAEISNNPEQDFLKTRTEIFPDGHKFQCNCNYGDWSEWYPHTH